MPRKALKQLSHLVQLSLPAAAQPLNYQISYVLLHHAQLLLGHLLPPSEDVRRHLAVSPPSALLQDGL